MVASSRHTQPPVVLSHVTLGFGTGFNALDDVSLTISPGEWVCVLGANGSGKSTLASVVCGLMAPDEGEVRLAGQLVKPASKGPDLDAYRLARRSLGLVFQNPEDQIVTNVVEDDVAFGPENLGVGSQQIRERVDRELARVALSAYAKADPARLSGGQRQRVTIAGALAMEPQVLVLDEPSSLLDVRGRRGVMHVMRDLRQEGATLLHVTHFMDEALWADRVIVMNEGRIVLEGTPREVFSCGKAIRDLRLETPLAAWLSDRLSWAGIPVRWTASPNDLADQIVALSRGEKLVPDHAFISRASSPMPLGISASGRYAPRSHRAPDAEVVLDVSNVSYSYGENSQTRGTGRIWALDSISFEVRRGTSTAILGQTGSGKSTLLRLLCGLERPDKGGVVVCGSNTSTRRGARAARHHIGYVMQHPERQLFANTVEEDVSFGPRNMGLDAAEVARRSAHALELVGLADRTADSPFDLSGGQQRLCALAGVLAMEPKILVLDEPTAGLDPQGRRLLRDILENLQKEGVTLVQVTHSMEDAVRANNILVLDQSRLTLSGTPREVFAPANQALLRGCGLGLPRALAFANKLAKRGMDGLDLPLTTDDLVGKLLHKLCAEEALLEPGRKWVR